MTITPGSPNEVESFEPNNAPQQQFIEDDVRDQGRRLKVVERVGTAELQRQLEFLYGVVGEPYPPPP
jgi:hypothetical protein